MFSVNDHVVFGNHGICVIKAIGPLDLSIAERGRLYYTLEPLYAQKNTIYTPVDNEKSSLRRAITREEALELIDRIPQVETVWILDEKRREEKYKEIMKQNDCMGLDADYQDPVFKEAETFGRGTEEYGARRLISQTGGRLLIRRICRGSRSGKRPGGRADRPESKGNGIRLKARYDCIREERRRP